MIKLSNKNGKEVWINPKYITAICEDENEPGFTAIYDIASGGDYWLVKEPPRQIINMIYTEETYG